jgi:hypothetical protein
MRRRKLLVAMVGLAGLAVVVAAGAVVFWPRPNRITQENFDRIRDARWTLRLARSSIRPERVTYGCSESCWAGSSPAILRFQRKSKKNRLFPASEGTI